MNKVKTIVALFFVILSLSSCRTQKEPVNHNRSIIGYWEGCDGRVAKFAYEGDKIIGRYVVLGRLKDFGFTKSEIGYEIEPNGEGGYKGKVKWRSVNSDHITWRQVQITIDGNNYTDEGSDRCGREMTRKTVK